MDVGLTGAGLMAGADMVTGAGGKMVFVKVRETYDLHTVKNKLSIIGIHTPGAGIIKKCYPGLLMQCKAYKPVKADVRIACASMLPADPLQVGVDSGDIAPEDMFNPILYKAMSNFGMSQIEARINAYLNTSNSSATPTITGESAFVDSDGIGGTVDQFQLYYGLLSETNTWKHANPQSGLAMSGLKPLVYEMLYSVGDNAYENKASNNNVGGHADFSYPLDDNTVGVAPTRVFKGHAKPMPWLNCTAYDNGSKENGFGSTSDQPGNDSTTVPAPMIYVGCIIIPPSKLHELYYRMVVEWTIEFSGIRPFQEITDWSGLEGFGGATHYQDYTYATTSKALGVEESNLTSEQSMVSANVDINKVM